MTPLLKMWAGSKRGLTLIELVCVVVIVGILGGTASVSYKNYLKKARIYKAKRVLSTLTQKAEVFKSSRGFYLPNFDEMNVSLSGQQEYSYVLICHDEDGKGGEDSVFPVHDLDFQNGARTVKSTTKLCGNIANNQAKGWMGHVLYRHFQGKIKPRSHLGIIDGGRVVVSRQVSGSSHFDLDYPTIGTSCGDPCAPAYSGAMSFSWPTNPNTDDLKATDDMAKEDSNKIRFAPVDSTDICKTRVNEGHNIMTQSEACVSVAQYALKPADVKNTLKDYVTNNTDVTWAHLTSSPSRFVVNAIACAESQNNCEQTASEEYHILSFGSQKILLEDKRAWP